MKTTRFFIIGVVMLALAMPPTVSAQTVSDVQSQIQALLAQLSTLQAQLLTLRMGSTTATSSATTTPGVGAGRHRLCRLVNRSLAEGAEGDDVRALQEFLIIQGVLSVNPTGFFGPITSQALRVWQSRNAIVSSGDAGTTGWGVFGPRTRAFLTRWCAGVSSEAQSNPNPPLENQFKVRSATSTNASNQPPTISNISGPLAVYVNRTNSWTISASDSEGQTLSYHISWGDSDSVQNVLEVLADIAGFSATSTFSHTYTRPGTYEITARVRDGQGGESIATTKVRVDPHTESSFLEQYNQLFDSYGNAIGTNTNPGTSYPTGLCDLTIGGEMRDDCVKRCTYSGTYYNDGALHPLSSSSQGNRTVCFHGQWMAEGIPCQFNGRSYPHSTQATCNGAINSSNQCVANSSARWKLNVCRFGQWQLEDYPTTSAPEVIGGAGAD